MNRRRLQLFRFALFHSFMLYLQTDKDDCITGNTCGTVCDINQTKYPRVYHWVLTTRYYKLPQIKLLECVIMLLCGTFVLQKTIPEFTSPQQGSISRPISTSSLENSYEDLYENAGEHIYMSLQEQKQWTSLFTVHVQVGDFNALTIWYKQTNRWRRRHLYCRFRFYRNRTNQQWINSSSSRGSFTCTYMLCHEIINSLVHEDLNTQ